MINGQPVPPMPSPGVPQAQPGAMPGAPQVGGVPNLPGARSSPLTPAMRKSLAMMAVLDGKPDQAATILDDKHHILAGPGGVMYDGDSGEVIGRIPTWKYTASGDRYDEGDPNAPKFLGQAPVNGADRVFDQHGNPIGWRMADGSLQALNQNYLATGGSETHRANLANEDVARQNARSGAVSAGASAQNANTTTANSGNVAPPPGFVIRGAR
jgi:hypothetical protein